MVKEASVPSVVLLAEDVAEPERVAEGQVEGLRDSRVEREDEVEAAGDALPLPLRDCEPVPQPLTLLVGDAEEQADAEPLRRAEAERLPCGPLGEGDCERERVPLAQKLALTEAVCEALREADGVAESQKEGVAPAVMTVRVGEGDSEGAPETEGDRELLPLREPLTDALAQPEPAAEREGEREGECEPEGVREPEPQPEPVADTLPDREPVTETEGERERESVAVTEGVCEAQRETLGLPLRVAAREEAAGEREADEQREELGEPPVGERLGERLREGDLERLGERVCVRETDCVTERVIEVVPEKDWPPARPAATRRRSARRSMEARQRRN